MTNPVNVARDLTTIVEYATMLHDQAIHNATDRLMPGGEAMVALGPVANQEAWEHRYETAERLALDTTYVELEDDDVPPLQTLRYWSDRYRTTLGAEWDHIPTIASEVNFLKFHLYDYIAVHEPMWDHFAKDVARAKFRLEAVLHAGERAERGAPCLYEACGGVRLVRKLVPFRDDDGNKAWRKSDWNCPRCHRSWDQDRYAAMVTAASEAAKFEDIDGETWCSDDYAARKVGRSVKTVRTWVNAGKVATVCLVAGRRMRFVSLSDVAVLDEKVGRRKRTTTV